MSFIQRIFRPAPSHLIASSRDPNISEFQENPWKANISLERYVNDQLLPTNIFATKIIKEFDRVRGERGNRVVVREVSYLDKSRGVNDEHRRIVRKRLELWRTLEHDNVLPLLDSRWTSKPFLMIEWSPSGNINEYIKANPEADKNVMLCQVATGLSFLHGRDPPMSHGNIHPMNIIINDRTKQAMLSDLEGCRFHRFGSSEAVRNVFGYTAPEIWQDDSPYSREGDMYSVGSLILGVMSGADPFHKAKAPGSKFEVIRSGKHPDPADHPRLPSSSLLWHLLRACWSSEASGRPSADEVKEQLMLIGQPEHPQKPSL